MPRQRRRIKSGTVYEICFRAKQGLPLVAYRVIDLIIASSLARAQRDDKVDLCHDLWNGSHAHMFIVAWDSYQCVNFYSEVQKKITEALKRLLGITHIQIWEGRVTVIEIRDLEKAKNRIAYLYANPAQDNLEESIDKFPGYSSWKSFLRCKDSLSAQDKKLIPWLRLPSIPKLSSPTLTTKEDDKLVRLLKARNRKLHELIRKPNAWMKCYGTKTDKETTEINNEIIKKLREVEKEEENKRKEKGWKVMGAAKLRSQPILAYHIPKKRERKIYVMASDNQDRIDAIEEQKDYSDKCDECYECWRRGDFTVVWPEGAFKPPLPPNMNILAGFG